MSYTIIFPLTRILRVIGELSVFIDDNMRVGFPFKRVPTDDMCSLFWRSFAEIPVDFVAVFLEKCFESLVPRFAGVNKIRDILWVKI